MFAIYLSEDFPLDDYENLAHFLTASETLVPAFIPPAVGLLSLDAVKYASEIDRLQTVLLPDRNIVSRFVRIARDGRVGKRDMPTQVSLAIMALAQIVDFCIEPSIAFHEYAHSGGNTEANAELSLFRVADHANPGQWIELALGRKDVFIPIIPAPSASDSDLAFPLHRWRRNYIAMLKVAELSLEDMSPLDKMTSLLDWMRDDFLVAAPAAVFACFLFAPTSIRAGALKGLRSTDRERAIAGVKNAAWDVTQVSELMRRASLQDEEGTRYIFVTADRVLRLVADMAVRLSISMSNDRGLAGPLSDWWPRKEATIIGEHLRKNIALAAEIRPKFRVSFTSEQLDNMAAVGEEVIRGYSP